MNEVRRWIISTFPEFRKRGSVDSIDQRIGQTSFPFLSSFVNIRGGATLRFNELVRLLEQNGFRVIREKGSIRYYAKADVDRLIRVDYHGAKEIPTGTCNAILKAAGLKGK